MARLGTAYGLHFRYKNHRPGHCFQGRYKAPLVEGDDYALRLTRYIHLNPVETRAASALSDAEKWQVLDRHKWSSLAGYLTRGSASDRMDYRWLGLMGPAKLQRRRSRAYLAQMLREEDPVLRESIEASSYAIGDEASREEMAEWVRQQSAAAPAKGDIASVPERMVTVDEVAEAVAEACGCAVEDLRVPRKRVGPARTVFLELACTLAGCSQRAMADCLGSVSEHAVGKARHRLLDALHADPTLARRVEKVEETKI